MRATGPLKLRIFIKDDQAGEAERLTEAVRGRAADFDLSDVSLAQEAAGPVIEVAGPEEALRRLWTAATELRGLGLMVLANADDRRSDDAPAPQP